MKKKEVGEEQLQEIKMRMEHHICVFWTDYWFLKLHVCIDLS